MYLYDDLQNMNRTFLTSLVVSVVSNNKISNVPCHGLAKKTKGNIFILSWQFQTPSRFID